MQGFIRGGSWTTFCIKAINSFIQLYFGHQVNYSYKSLDQKLTYAKHVIYHLIAYNSNHSRCSNSMFIGTITFHNTITTMLGLAKFLTVRERRRVKSISTSQEFIPNTNPGRPDQRSPQVTFGTTQVHISWVRLAPHNQGQLVAKTFRPGLPLGSCLAPHTSLLPSRVCILTKWGLARVELLGFTVGMSYLAS